MAHMFFSATACQLGPQGWTALPSHCGGQPCPHSCRQWLGRALAGRTASRFACSLSANRGRKMFRTRHFLAPLVRKERNLCSPAVARRSVVIIISLNNGLLRVWHGGCFSGVMPRGIMTKHASGTEPETSSNIFLARSTTSRLLSRRMSPQTAALQTL